MFSVMCWLTVFIVNGVLEVFWSLDGSGVCGYMTDSLSDGKRKNSVDVS